MVVCHLKDSAQYETLHPNLKKAFDFLRCSDFYAMETGRVAIDGTDVYALVQSYQTADPVDKKWETHEKYMDIQYVASGKETIGWLSIGMLEPSTSYNPEKDIRFYHDDGPSTALRLEEGFLALLLPEDIHKPGCIAEASEEVIKVVVKVKMVPEKA